MHVRLPLPLLFGLALPVSLNGQQDAFGDFVPVCSQALAENSPMDDAGSQRVCSCIADESQKAGISASEISRITEDLQRDPKGLRDEAVREAASGCVQSAMEELSRLDKEARAERNTDRNQAPSVAVSYNWTGYWYTEDGGSEVLQIDPERHSAFDLGESLACALEAVQFGEYAENGLEMIKVSRRVACDGVDVRAEGMNIEGTNVVCAHSKDAKSANNSQAQFKLSREGHGDVLGTLIIMCYVTEVD